MGKKLYEKDCVKSGRKSCEKLKKNCETEKIGGKLCTNCGKCV